MQVAALNSPGIFLGKNHYHIRLFSFNFDQCPFEGKCKACYKEQVSPAIDTVEDGFDVVKWVINDILLDRLRVLFTPDIAHTFFSSYQPILRPGKRPED